MRLINSIEVSSGNPGHPGSRIELWVGDLTDMVASEAVDILIVSAFPGDYTPSPRSLIGALYRKGVDVEELARHKSVDLRQSFSAWLSPAIESRPGIHFQRILCLEPSPPLSPEMFVGDLFRALSPFLWGDPPVKKIAMPIITSGNRGLGILQVMKPLLSASIQWLRIGMPVHRLRIVAYNEWDARKAEEAFEDAIANHGLNTASTIAKKGYDVFLSYSHRDSHAASAFKEILLNNGYKVFFDQLSIDKGADWQKHVFEALETCLKMVAVYSPDYLDSKICQEEFLISMIRRRKQSNNIIFPIYWRSTNLPSHMEMLDYEDCREQAIRKIPDACLKLMGMLRGAE